MAKRWFLGLAVGIVCAACGGSDEDPEAAYARDGQGNPPPSETPFCANEAAKHVFCADFDEGAVEKNWTELDRRRGGTIATAEEPVRSLPRAAAVRASGDGSVAYLVKTLSGMRSHVHLGFDVRIDQVGDGTGGARIFNLQASPTHDVTFNVHPEGDDGIGCSASEFKPGVSNGIDCASGLSRATWTHFEVDVTYVQNSGTMVVRLGRRPDALLTLSLGASQGAGAESGLKFSLGVSPYAGGGEWRVYVDNVTVD